MKKLVKWGLISIAGFILFLVVLLLVVVPWLLSPEKIKAYTEGPLSQQIGRQVKLGRASFNLFSGFRLENLSVANQKGFSPVPMIAAQAIELHYDFWALFSGRVVINDVALVGPEILIEKNPAGLMNYSDFTKSSQPDPRPQPASHQSTKPPFSIFIKSFSLKSGKLTYNDQAAKTVNEVKNLNLKVTGFSLSPNQQIAFDSSAIVVYQKKDIPVSLRAKVKADLFKQLVEIPDCSLTIASESANLYLQASEFAKGPVINAKISSKKLALDPLLALIAAGGSPNKKTPAKPGELTRSINQATAALPAKLSFSLDIDLANISFQGFKLERCVTLLRLRAKKAEVLLKDIRLYEGRLTGVAVVDLNTPGLAYKIADLELANFNSTDFVNNLAVNFLTFLPDHKDLVNKVSGQLDAEISLSGRGVEPQPIMSNLSAQAKVVIRHGQLKRVKSLASVGEVLKSNTLKGDIPFGSLTFTGRIKNKVVNIESLNLTHQEFKINFKGGLDLNKLIWISGNRLTLKLSSTVTSNLPKEFTLMRDKNGWLEVVFELTGSLTKPFPKPIFDKAIEAAIGKIKLKIEAKKIEIQQKVQTELATKEAEAKKAVDQAVEQQKQQLQDETKKQLKNLINF
ncbi:hypothetical protein A2311_06790 [candidate division WOR-1 bacterium RIFOXYB2_FULL_48_7]|uniref:AsmA-like C-terminal domain-containing protein n=1 Tax=candidate division WOR-1 bacterium RIFOXYB2_FULL_48_7 TaxID=1802583 RepID=A0A1F4TVS4_UNCSA|nr:MAG: hypothetical protein A2311_06790 [candidate division WOR-1 bacterium RIFOXYB2_FULL_48_7]